MLLAEDSPTNQFVVSQLLKGFGLHLDTVGDGLEAVAAALRCDYDLIYMDSRMPELDGVQATREIRAHGGRLADIPIIAFTANAFLEDVQACFAAGMDNFVAKPVQKEVFLDATVRALSKPRAAPRGILGQPSADKMAGVPAFDRETIATLIDALGTDNVRKMLAVFVEETEARLSRMLDQQVQPMTLQREAHTLKGGAATAGAPLLSTLAATLERVLYAGEPAMPDFVALRAAFNAFRDELAEHALAPVVETA